MNRRVRLSRAAKSDLDDIWDYVADESGIEQAGRLIDSITNKFALLGRHPRAGRRRDEIHAGVRSMPAGSYVIYYRWRKNAVEIAHVFHAMRDQRKAWRPTN